MDQSSISIPAKSNFKFGELTNITGVKPYVLRFWETEFEDIHPLVGEDGQKIYSRSDVECFLKIKTLLFERKLTLIEAKHAIKDPQAFLGQTSGTEVLGNNEEALCSLTEALTFIKSLKHKYRW